MALNLKNFAAGLMALSLVSAGPAFAHQHEGQHYQGQHPGGNKGGWEQRKTEMMDQLNLTPQQRQKMQTLMQNKREQHKSTHEALQAKRQQLMQMMQNGSGSREQALALHREISAMQAEMMAQRINNLYDMKSILTPEQFQKFQSMMPRPPKDDFEGRGAQGGQPSGGGHNGPRHNGGGYQGPQGHGQ